MPGGAAGRAGLPLAGDAEAEVPGRAAGAGDPACWCAALPLAAVRLIAGRCRLGLPRLPGLGGRLWRRAAMACEAAARAGGGGDGGAALQAAGDRDTGRLSAAAGLPPRLPRSGLPPGPSLPLRSPLPREASSSWARASMPAWHNWLSWARPSRSRACGRRAGRRWEGHGSGQAGNAAGQPMHGYIRRSAFSAVSASCGHHHGSPAAPRHRSETGAPAPPSRPHTLAAAGPRAAPAPARSAASPAPDPSARLSAGPPHGEGLQAARVAAARGGGLAPAPDSQVAADRRLRLTLGVTLRH